MAEVQDEPTFAGERAESTRTMPTYAPLADIYELDDALVVSVEMPGVDPQSIDITVEKKTLSIRGRGRSSRPEGCSLTHGEFRDGDYERSFSLSDAIDAERIEAEARNGVLKLTLPKAKPAPAKSISVKTG